MKRTAIIKNIIYTFNNEAEELFLYVQQSLLLIWRCLYLFLSGIITLKTIFYHFHHYITKAYKCINQHFEKPNRSLFQQYRCFPLFLHLGQWQASNEEESLIQVHYAAKPKNPE